MCHASGVAGSGGVTKVSRWCRIPLYVTSISNVDTPADEVVLDLYVSWISNCDIGVNVKLFGVIPIFGLALSRFHFSAPVRLHFKVRSPHVVNCV
jgi:hypothetical protein